MNPEEDTEWNDALRAHGILPPKPEDPSVALEQAVEEAVEHAHAHRLEGKSLEELDEILDDQFEDEEFVESYRRQRMAELTQQAQGLRFGEVVHISKPEYTEEVTNASQTAPVVLQIAGEGTQQTRLLSALFRRAAAKFRDVKFVEIDCRQINERYPTSQTPTILIYKNKDILDQQITLAGIGGDATSLVDFEAYLVNKGVLKRNDSRLETEQDDSDY